MTKRKYRITFEEGVTLEEAAKTTLIEINFLNQNSTLEK